MSRHIDVEALFKLQCSSRLSPTCPAHPILPFLHGLTSATCHVAVDFSALPDVRIGRRGETSVSIAWHQRLLDSRMDSINVSACAVQSNQLVLGLVTTRGRLAHAVSFSVQTTRTFRNSHAREYSVEVAKWLHVGMAEAEHSTR